MADTLRALAGAAFRTADVISALHKPLAPEERVLDRYVFLPHARAGIAAALDAPFAWTLPARASARLRAPVIDERGGIDAEMTVRVYGPADVTEIDLRQVIRAFPKADAVDAEVDDLAHVEFDRPDFPWLFTPAGPDAAGRLVPWITLVVAERRHVDWGERRGSAQAARIRRDQLQPLSDAWAWAHAQVMGARGATAEAEPTLARRLGEGNAAGNLSRLICPRRLDKRTAYVACVVPTFLAGAQAALGLTPVATLAPAWGTATDFTAGDPLDMVPLPVFYSWRFGTAEEGNFESLARKLRPAVAPPGVGRRRVDATQPFPGAALAPGDRGAEIVVEGPVVSPQPPESDPGGAWPPEAAQHWDAAVTEALVERLNRADAQAHEADPGPPLVGPPLYGGLHARQPRIESEPAAAAATATRATGPRARVSRRKTPTVTVSGRLDAASDAQTLPPGASGSLACTRSVIATSAPSLNRAKWRRCSAAPTCLASCARRRVRFAASTPITWFQAASIRSSCSACTTRAPRPPTMRRRGSVLSSRNQAGCAAAAAGSVSIRGWRACNPP